MSAGNGMSSDPMRVFPAIVMVSPNVISLVKKILSQTTLLVKNAFCGRREGRPDNCGILGCVEMRHG